MKMSLMHFGFGLASGVIITIGSYILVLSLSAPAVVEAAKHARTEPLMKAHAYGCRDYFNDFGTFPPKLAALRHKNHERNYLELPDTDFAKDGWGRPLVYTSPASQTGFAVLTSLGSDGVSGGVGDAADVTFRLTDYGIVRPW